MFVAFAVAPCLASSGRPEIAFAARIRHAGLVFLTAFAGAWVAAALVGAPQAFVPALVVGGAATLAAGVAAMLRARGASAAVAALFGPAVVMAPAGALFVADPYIEWRGPAAESPARADLVLRMNPLASMGQSLVVDGVALDWQRSTWLYDGPSPGARGLSVIGQYYPSRPTPALVLALTAAALGTGLCVTARRPRESRQLQRQDKG
jgi:hypothetical protein